MVVFSCLLILVGCSSNTTPGDEGKASENNEGNEENLNLIDNNEVTEGSWISSAGTEREDEDMVYTTKIDYDPNESYHLSHGSYISYYKGEEFIKTVLHEGENPIEIKKVEQADTIVVSFRTAFLESIKLSSK